MPIAVVPFGWDGQGAAPFDVSASSPPISRAAAASSRCRRGTCSSGRRRGARSISRTGAAGYRSRHHRPAHRSRPDEYTIQFQLFDVFRGEQLLGYRQPAKQTQMRAASHLVADMIYEGADRRRGHFLHANRLRDGRWQAAAAGFRLVVADCRRRERAGAGRVGGAADVAGVVAGRSQARLRVVRAEAASIYVQTLRSGARQTRVESGRRQRRAGVVAGRRTLALTLSKSDGNLDIYTLDLADQVLKRLTERPSIDTEPAWSADGKTIYFTSDRAGRPQVYRIAAAGGRRSASASRALQRSPAADAGWRGLAVCITTGATIELRWSISSAAYAGADARSLDESPSFAPNGETLDLCDASGRARGAGDGDDRRPDSSADHLRCRRRPRAGLVAISAILISLKVVVA